MAERKDLQHHTKKLLVPLAGGGLAYILSGVVLLGVFIFGAIYIGQWIAGKKSPAQITAKASSKKKK